MNQEFEKRNKCENVFIQQKKLFHGKYVEQIRCLWFLFLFYANCKNDKKIAAKCYLRNKVSNFSRDKESNVWREGSTGEKLSWQKSLANSKKDYTQFIQGALLTTYLLVNLNLGQ